MCIYLCLLIFSRSKATIISKCLNLKITFCNDFISLQSIRRYPRLELARGENPVTCCKLRYLLHNFQIEILFRSSTHTRRGLPRCEGCPRRPHYKPLPPPPLSAVARGEIAKEYNLSSHIVPICQCLVKRQPPISDGEVEL